MLKLKENGMVDIAYFIVVLLSVGIFIFEIPFAVFFSPLILFVAFFIYKLYTKADVSASLSLFILSLFTVAYVYFIYSPLQGLYYQGYIHLHSVIMFLIGYNFLSDRKTQDRLKYLEYFFGFVSLFYIVYTVITVIYYYKYTSADLIYRQYYSVWYADTVKPATVLSMSMVIPLGTGVYFLFYGHWKKKLIGTAFVVFTVILNIQTSTRTLLFLLPVILFAELIFWLILKKNKKLLGWSILAVCVFAVVLFLITYRKIFEMLALKLEDYPLARVFRDGFISQGRIDYAENVLKDFSVFYKGGGMHSKVLGTPHNIWLYIYDWGGFVSFFIYILFTLVIVADCILLMLNKNISVEIKMLLATLGGVIGVEYFLEPFILPLPSFYILCMFVFGLTAGLSTAGRKKYRIVS